MGLVSEMVWGGQVGRLESAAATKGTWSVLPHQWSVMRYDHVGGSGAWLLINQGLSMLVSPPRPILVSVQEALSDPPLPLFRTTPRGTSRPCCPAMDTQPGWRE